MASMPIIVSPYIDNGSVYITTSTDTPTITNAGWIYNVAQPTGGTNLTWNYSTYDPNTTGLYTVPYNILYNYQNNVQQGFGNVYYGIDWGSWDRDRSVQGVQVLSDGEYRRQVEEEEKKRKAAEDKAEELLLMCLNDKQKEVYLKHGYIEINTDSGKYRIHKGWSKNIDKVGVDDKPECKYCIHPSILVPTADNMLAQKLMLECNEKEFLRVANRWSV